MARLRIYLHGNEIRVLELAPGSDFTFGRSSGCDIQLEDQSGISRNHFRLYENGGQWTVDVMAKFGELIYNGEPVQSLVLNDGAAFKLASYDFHFSEDGERGFADEAYSQPPESDTQRLPTIASSRSNPMPPSDPNDSADDDFAGNDEATKILPSIFGLAYLRLTAKGHSDEDVPLEGSLWVGGREDGCEIPLNDRKASRRQFEVRKTSHEYFITDLGSSNGTLLNGVALPSHEPRALRSGDVIQVGGLTLFFEIRDPHFEKKLMVISPEIMASSPMVVDNPYEFINYPVSSGPGGAIRVDAQNDRTSRLLDEKKKLVRVGLIGAAVVILLVAYFATPDDGPKGSNSPTVDPFTKLSPNKQKMIKETFSLAQNLYFKGKCELAADQLKKIHDDLPEGYQNSLAIAEECRAAAEQRDRLDDIRKEQERIEENKRIVNANLRECEPLANSTYNLDALQACLGPSINLDPENLQLAELSARVRSRIEKRDFDLAKQKDYSERVEQGRAMFSKAQNLEKKGDRFAAIEAYRKHAASNLPDPAGLKSKSKANLQTLMQKMNEQVEESLKLAEAAHTAQNYKEAIAQIQRAKEVDPNSIRAAELNAKVRKELNLKLREIYEEAVIAEGLGNIDGAKPLWKKIVEMDHPAGEYFKKARNKLRTYGGM